MSSRYLPLAGPDEFDWLRKRSLDLPAVIRSKRDKHDPPGLHGILAVDDVEQDRWLVRAYLDVNEGTPLFIARVGVEHLGYEPDDLDSWRPPHNTRPVTSTVMRGIRFEQIRRRAQEYLGLGAAIIRAQEIQGARPSRFERDALQQAAAAARRPYLRRDGNGYPPEFYREVARVLVELTGRGDGALRRFRTEFPRLHPELRLQSELPEETVRTWRTRAGELGFIARGESGRRGFRPGPNLNREEDE